jgi:hypothetical protein
VFIYKKPNNRSKSNRGAILGSEVHIHALGPTSCYTHFLVCNTLHRLQQGGVSDKQEVEDEVGLEVELGVELEDEGVGLDLAR